MINNCLKITGLLVALSFSTSNAFSQSISLQEVLHYALNSDPQIYEAKSNVSVAQEQTKISQAGHYPIISVTDTRVLSQRYDDEPDKQKSKFGLHGTVNLYAWGGIEAGIERDRNKQDFYQYKLGETREQLGKTVGQLYLNALRAKESLQTYQKSLERHKKMLGDVQIIAQYDEGRAYEITEVQSRLLSVEATIAEQKRVLQTSLSQLNRYSQRPIQAGDLIDPFAKINSAQFIKQYQNESIQTNPSYQAQHKELESAKADIKVAKAKRLPALNLESDVNNKGYSVYLGVSWNVLDEAARHTVKQSYYSEEVAKAKLNTIQLEVEEQARTAAVEMRENSQRVNVLNKQIAAHKQVVSNYELQFQIAERSLLDVLNSYQELTAVEIAEISAKNDFRDAALSYLVSQSRMSSWAGVANINISSK